MYFKENSYEILPDFSFTKMVMDTDIKYRVGEVQKPTSKTQTDLLMLGSPCNKGKFFFGHAEKKN